ncbi:MAG: FliA/WhiG family RNA polymerase sigma factor [Bacillota bacterium]
MTGKTIKECYQDHDSIDREKLIMDYLPMVKQTAAKISIALPPSLDEADLVGSGIIGLLEAWERYDPSRGVPFAVFAARRVKGAMIDELRRVTPAPRSFFTRFRQMHEVTDQLRQDLHREPEQRELAAALGWPAALVEQLWAHYNLLTLVSLDQVLFKPGGEEGLRLEELIVGPAQTPETVLLRKEQRQLLAAALSRLTSREKLVLSLYYSEELSQKEIAALLQVSAVRVSQLHARAIERLREELSLGRFY